MYDSYHTDRARSELSRSAAKPPVTSGMALASCILGVTSFVLPCINVLTGILAVILGIVGLARIRGSRGECRGTGYATVGIITGIIAPIMVTGGVVWYVISDMTQNAESKLRANPVLVEHLGTIEKGGFRSDLIASGEDNDKNTWVYRVHGSKGDGVVTVSEEDGEILWARLKLPSGKVIDLPLDDDDEPAPDPIPERPGQKPPVRKGVRSPPWGK